MKLHKLLTLAVSFLLSLNFAFADVAEGEKLFKANCTSCHAFTKKVLGPPLQNVHKKHDVKWLLKWIKNSQAMVKSGDAKAVALFEENNKSVMQSFENLSDKEITSIVEYIKEESEHPKTPPPPGPGVGGGTETAAGSGFYNETTLIALSIMAIILFVIVIILIRIKGVVQDMYLQKFPEEAEEMGAVNWRENRSDFRYKLFKKHPVVGTLFVMLAFMLVFGLYGFDYGNKEIGVQKGYAPVQPINYSHELHAGKYKINCLYCHSGADKGKQATIPSPSTCMNCHMAVKAEKNGVVSSEIQKIYDAVGWDAAKGAYDPARPKTPIRWVRIHNLPDHAYFNHAQHVKIGKVECQACHGPIETMPVVSQQRSLQMGWCINCHREAKVDVANNDYYEKLHAGLKSDGKQFITVGENGGLECGKCHY